MNIILSLTLKCHRTWIIIFVTFYCTFSHTFYVVLNPHAPPLYNPNTCLQYTFPAIICYSVPPHFHSKITIVTIILRQLITLNRIDNDDLGISYVFRELLPLSSI